MRHLDDTTSHVVLVVVPDSLTSFSMAADWLDGQFARAKVGSVQNLVLTVPESTAVALMRERVRPYAQKSSIGAMPLKFYLTNGGALDKIVHLTHCTASLFGESLPA